MDAARRFSRRSPLATKRKHLFRSFLAFLSENHERPASHHEDLLCCWGGERRCRGNRTVSGAAFFLRSGDIERTPSCFHHIRRQAPVFSLPRMAFLLHWDATLEVFCCPRGNRKPNRSPVKGGPEDGLIARNRSSFRNSRSLALRSSLISFSPINPPLFFSPNQLPVPLAREEQGDRLCQHGGPQPQGRCRRRIQRRYCDSSPHSLARRRPRPWPPHLLRRRQRRRCHRRIRPSTSRPSTTRPSAALLVARSRSSAPQTAAEGAARKRTTARSPLLRVGRRGPRPQRGGWSFPTATAGAPATALLAAAIDPRFPLFY